MKIFLMAARIGIALPLVVNAHGHLRLATPFDALVGLLVLFLVVVQCTNETDVS